MSKNTTIGNLAWVLSLLSCGVAAGADPGVAAAPPANIPTVSMADIDRAGVFYVGGQYVGEPGKEIMEGAMYVEVLVPRKIRHAQPIVMLHGAGQTAVNWLQTPDGRTGWAYFFLHRGYVVYLTDEPARGRSAYVPDVDGPLTIRTAAQLSQLWTAVDAASPWPQGARYSQWPGSGPGKGKMHDPVFDDFARTQVQYPANNLDRATVDAYVALLDRIGTPVVLLTHSIGGAFGWSVADARPRDIAAVIAIEPAGPPIQAVDAAHQAYNGKPNLPWGLTNLPLEYEPTIKDAAELQTAVSGVANVPGRVNCYLQTGSPRRLKNLVGIPVLLISSEASYHAIFDACTAQWLNQAGVHTDYVELASVGITGNGHEMMLEKNSDEIAKYLAGWLDRTVH
ncbi:MAG: alpha/beta hydrolase [Steroidobacteraceae bacterium]|jgi:pimeloyl-ACP methyl ester carboxylesterase